MTEEELKEIERTTLAPGTLYGAGDCDDDIRKLIAEVRRLRDAKLVPVSPSDVTVGYRMRLPFPPHKCGLYLTHNEHRDSHQTVEEWDEPSPGHENDTAAQRGWISEEERRAAIATGEVWMLQWYPDTPIGYWLVLGATLEAVLAAARIDTDPVRPPP